MAIQITLSANEFNHAGTYNDHQYTSIRVNYTSNGRIYFHTVRNGMRLSTMAKQMKLDNGNVIISFGKNDKLIIGTYTDDSIQEETKEETSEYKTPEEKFMNDEYITNLEFIELCKQYNIELSYSLNKFCKDKLDNIGLGKYEYRSIGRGMFPKELSGIVDELYEAIESSKATEQTEEEEVVTLTCSKSLHGFGHSVWVNDNRNTNQSMTYYNPNGNESVTIHMHANNYDKYWEVENYIYSLMKEYAHSSDLWTILIDKLNNKYNPVNKHASTHSPIQDTTPAIKEVKQPNKIEEVFPKLDMVAEYAKVNYIDNIAEVTFTNATESHTIKLNKHKRWSHKKYVNKAIEHTGIKPSWEFRFGWEYIS